MKLKRDFISNSSSASFIIADKSGQLTNMRVNLQSIIPELNLFDILSYEEDSYALDEFIDNLERTLKYYESHFSKDFLLKQIKELKDLKKNENIKIYRFSASDDGDIIETGLCYRGLEQEMFLDDCVILINGEGGY